MSKKRKGVEATGASSEPTKTVRLCVESLAQVLDAIKAREKLFDVGSILILRA